MIDIAIVIINYKTPQLTIECVDSIIKSGIKYNYHIVIVDNKSGGNDVELIKEFILDQSLSSFVTLIPAGKNGGFSYGNNIGIKSIPAKTYLLANADTIFRINSVNILYENIVSSQEIAIVGPRLEWKNGDPQISCFNFHTPFSEIIYSAGTSIITKLLDKFIVPIPVSEYKINPQWISFACVLIRGDIFQKIGFMDEGYFMYYEDVDFCRMIYRSGFKVLYDPTAHVVHLRGQSSGVKKIQQERKRLPLYHYKSRSRYYLKFYTFWGWITANLCWNLGRGISLFRELIFNKAQTVADKQFLDIWNR